MSELEWIKGSINPPNIGEYYTITRAKKDLIDILNHGEVMFPKCGIEMTTDYWDGEQWERLGKENATWEVLAWERVLLPEVPDCFRDDLRKYFGRKCRWTGKTWEMEDT